MDAAQANYDDIHQKYLDAKDDSSDSTEDIAKAQNNLPNVEDNVLNKSTEYQNAKKEASDADAKLSSAQSDYDSKLELYKADPTNTDKAQAFGEAADVLKNAQEEATAKNNAVSSTKDSVHRMILQRIQIKYLILLIRILKHRLLFLRLRQPTIPQ